MFVGPLFWLRLARPGGPCLPRSGEDQAGKMAAKCAQRPDSPVRRRIRHRPRAYSARKAADLRHAVGIADREHADPLVNSAHQPGEHLARPDLQSPRHAGCRPCARRIASSGPGCRSAGPVARATRAGSWFGRGLHVGHHRKVIAARSGSTASACSTAAGRRRHQRAVERGADLERDGLELACRGQFARALHGRGLSGDHDLPGSIEVGWREHVARQLPRRRARLPPRRRRP